MILLRKGGELAAFHYSWIWCLLLLQKGQSILLVTLSLSFDLSVFGFGTYIIEYFHAIFNVKFMLLRRLLRSCYTSHTMPVSHYKPLTESDVNKILGEPIDPAFSFPSFPSISTCFIASRKLPAIVIRLTGLTFFPSFTYQP